MMKNNLKANIIGYGRLLLFVILIIGIYFSTFQWLVIKDWARDDYSHGMLIPFIVMYLVWEKKNHIASTPAQMSWAGFILFIPGLMFYWLGELAGEFFMLYISFWLISVSLVWIQMGYERLKVLAFPFFIALAMFPLPSFINVKLTFQLRLISSKLGVMMLHLYGMSAFREGNVIDLGFTKLQVVDACSGLRYLFPLLILSALVVYFYKSKMWKKVVLIIASIPLTIVTNSLRIALTGVLYEKFGPAVAEGFFHDFEGWFIFMFSLAILLGGMWTLNKVFPEHKTVDDMELSDVEVPFKVNAGLTKPQFFISVALLSLTLFISQTVEFRESIPIARSFNEFPMKIGSWQGSKQTMEQEIIDTLDLNDYIMADYVDDTGRGVNFYVAYYESQRKGESIHSPGTCLRGGGWEFKSASRIALQLDNGKAVPVNRSLIEKGKLQQVSYYWFPSRGRNLTNAYEMKIYNFWDALTRQRTDGALVRLIAYNYPGETIEDTEKRLQAFVKSVLPVLNEFLPQ